MTRVAGRVLAAALAAALLCASPAGAQGPPAGEAPGTLQVGGSWTGVRLRCQKDEGKLVRCGTPAPFAITFAESGTGATPDDSLPQSFTWRWLSANEIGITAEGGGEEVRLFAVERDADMLTFQAYIYLPTADPGAKAEERYIHYVFGALQEQRRSAMVRARSRPSRLPRRLGGIRRFDAGSSVPRFHPGKRVGYVIFSNVNAIGSGPEDNESVRREVYSVQNALLAILDPGLSWRSRTGELAIASAIGLGWLAAVLYWRRRARTRKR